MIPVLCMTLIPIGVVVFALLCGWANGDFRVAPQVSA